VIDLQVNGVGATSFSRSPSVDEYRAAAAELAAHGTDGFLATVPSAPADRYTAILDAAEAARDAGIEGLLGVHLEGPFLSMARRGAHPESVLRRPDPSWLAGLLDRHRGLVTMVTLAPELPGALEVVAACRERGVLVSVGHSVASPDEAAAAAPEMVTHLFNGMDPLHHRRPGLVGWALTEPSVVCGLIADGIHVDRVAIRLAFLTKGADGIALVSDAVGGEPGARVLDGAWRLPDGAWRLPDGTLAGAASLQDRGLEVCVEAGVSLDDARAAATSTPKRLLGLL